MFLMKCKIYFKNNKVFFFLDLVDFVFLSFLEYNSILKWMNGQQIKVLTSAKYAFI